MAAVFHAPGEWTVSSAPVAGGGALVDPDEGEEKEKRDGDGVYFLHPVGFLEQWRRNAGMRGGAGTGKTAKCFPTAFALMERATWPQRSLLTGCPWP